MRVLITLSHLGLGGTESYSVTVAEQLERLGHPVRLHAAGASDAGRELASSRGLRLTVGDHELGALDGIDAVIAQDLASAYLLADRPELRRAFVVHGLASFEQPPGELGGAPPVVALNDRMLARVEALAARPAAIRLRQPIDLDRFRPKQPNRPRARRVLVLSNALVGDHMRLLDTACSDLGLELRAVGGIGRSTTVPEQAIAAADVVVGYGRSVLEAMAMGKAAYVFERSGGDGWVTPETYSSFEADGFAGGATETVIDAARLRSDLASYTPELGMFGFDLVRIHHTATRHAEALVRLLDSGEGPAAADSHEALALMVRAQTRTLAQVGGLELECVRLREEVESEREARLAAEAKVAALAGSPFGRLFLRLRGLRRRWRAARRAAAGRAS